jgi:hypothetical protein
MKRAGRACVRRKGGCGGLVLTSSLPFPLTTLLPALALLSLFAPARTPPPPWSEKVFYRYGYSRLIVYNASYAEYEWVSSIDGTIGDRMAMWANHSSEEPYGGPCLHAASGSGGGGSANANKLSPAAIAGIAIGITALVSVVVVAAVYVCGAGRSSANPSTAALLWKPPPPKFKASTGFQKPSSKPAGESAEDGMARSVHRLHCTVVPFVAGAYNALEQSTDAWRYEDI